MNAWRELTFPVDALKDAALVVEGDRARVLVDPLRWRVLEVLGAGKSVAEISQALDVTDARVQYHLQRLEQTGVVRVAADGADPRAWRCSPTVGKVRVRVPCAAREQLAEAMPADVVGSFNQAFCEAGEGMYGATFQQSINHNRARLSPAQAAEFNRRLLALIEEYFPPGKGDRSGVKYGFYGVLTPIDLHPLGD